MDLTNERQHTIEPLAQRISPDAVMALAVLVLISGLVAIGLSPKLSGDSIVRCDRAAVEAASLLYDPSGNARQWRQERLLAFQHCLDEALQSPHK
jgi:hypothetical protein